MKMYILCHNWLSDRQHGIQSNHALTRMPILYTNDDFQKDYDKWVKNHQTMVFLKGGGHANLLDWELDLLTLNKIGLSVYPTQFCEDAESLNGACTSVVFLANDAVCEILESFNDNRADVNMQVMTLKEEYGLSSDNINTIARIANARLA